MKKLIEIVDKSIREEIGGYYIVSESRMNNILDILKDGAKRIGEMSKIIENQQDEIKRLSLLLIDSENGG